MMHRANRPLTPLPSRTRHDIWLCDNRGYRVALLNDYVSCSYNLSTRDTGGMTLEMPYPWSARIKDYALVEMWRKIGERETAYIESFVMMSRPQALGSKGTPFLTLSGPTLTGFVVSDKRVVQALDLPDGAPISTDAPGAHTGALDDLLKTWVGVTAMQERDGDSSGRDLRAGLRLSVGGNQGQGMRTRSTASLTPMASLTGNLVAQSEQSVYVPRRLYYRVRPTSFDPLTVVFETLVDRYGAYRGLTSARPVILSQANGTLGALDMEQDRTSEVNSVLVKYTAAGGTRLTRVTDLARQKVTPYAHREGFYTADAALGDAAEAEAQYRLRQGKPRRMVRATTTPSAVLRYGVDYHLGDVVVLEAFGRQWDAEIVAESSSPQGDAWGVSLRLDEWE